MTTHQGPATPILALPVLLLAVAVLLQAGCASLGADPGSPAPADLALQFRIITTDNRMSYFDVSRQGKLSFAGGRNALTSTTRPISQLTAAQREQIWRIIIDNHLPRAREAGMFAHGEKVTYELTVHSSDGGFRLRAIDDQAPGLADLEKLLTEFKSLEDVKLPALER